jgi:ubiquinone/menaquinone biosynthesis C-methylase UbiE
LEWAEILVNSTVLKPGARVLDVACGTGIVARTAAPIVGGSGKVVGLDLNPGMLAVARRESEQYAAESEWHEASATEMPLADAVFDNVYCQCGIMFFPDRSAAMNEMQRVLAPGGQLAANVWRSLERTPGFEALEQALANHVGDDAAAIVRSPFVIDTPDELHKLLYEAGFDNIRVILDIRMVRFPSVKAFFNCYTGGSPLVSHVADIDNRETLISEMEERLSPYLDHDGLAFPIEGLLVTASK